MKVQRSRAESCDKKQSAGGANTLQLCGQYHFGEQTEEDAGSKHIANSFRLGFIGKACSLGLESLRWCSKLIGAPQPTLEAFLLHGIRDQLHEENENSTLNGYPPEKKKLFDGCTMREVKRRINWACINFSHIGEEELPRFMHKLAETFVSTMMNFCPVPKMSIHSNSASASDIENTLKAMHTLFTRMDGNGKGLLIIILPEDASSDEKVKGVCEKLGIIYHCCFPEHGMKPTKQYMKYTADKISEEINKEIRQVEGWEEEDSEKESEEDETPVVSDEEMEVSSCEEESGETGESEQLEEEDTGDTEGSEQIEEEDTEDTEGSEQLEEDDGSEQLDSFDQQDIDGCRKDLPVKRGNVSSWACINFSGMNEKETLRFLDKFRMACVCIGMDFRPWPLMLSHGKSALTADIEDTVFGTHVKLSAIFANTRAMESQIRLLIVILPDKPEFADKVEEACEGLGVVCQYCSPKNARSPSRRYLEYTAHYIEAKVLRAHEEGMYLPIVRTAIPFLSEAPTFVFGGAISPYSSTSSIASVVGLLDWPGANRYKCLLSSQPHDVIIKDLGSLLSQHVHIFHKSTKKMPTRIIYFRNDDAEAQLSYTFEHEINVIRMVCPQAQITFVVVAQRPSDVGSEIGEDCNLTKFFYSNVDEGSNTLVSYRVLHDDNHFTADTLNSLRISLCTPCIRWTYPQILMAPPAYFARIAALIGGKLSSE